MSPWRLPLHNVADAVLALATGVLSVLAAVSSAAMGAHGAHGAHGEYEDTLAAYEDSVSIILHLFVAAASATLLLTLISVAHDRVGSVADEAAMALYSLAHAVVETSQIKATSREDVRAALNDYLTHDEQRRFFQLSQLVLCEAYDLRLESSAGRGPSGRLFSRQPSEKAPVLGLEWDTSPPERVLSPMEEEEKATLL